MQHRAEGGKAAAGRSPFGTFLMIILGIFGVLLVLRLIGGLFNRSAGQGIPAGMGMPRQGMGGGPGYGGPGYGGGGGGFFSSVLGGLGGALAGNWLYDQFSGGRHGQYGSADAGHVADSTGYTDRAATRSSVQTTILAEAPHGMTPAVVEMSAAAIGAAVATGGRRRR